MRKCIGKFIASMAVAATIIGAVPVFAANCNMDDGYAYNTATYSGGLRKCSAGTINNRNGEYASLYVLTTYYNGDESTYWSGVQEESATASFGWDWTEDYFSIHRLYATKVGGARDYVELSDS